MTTDGYAPVLDTLKVMWEERDPVPADLAARICFALELEHLEVELARLEDELGLVGARSEEQARTLTFTAASLSAMVTLGDAAGDRIRLDGWIGDGGGLVVTLRGPGGETCAETTADEDGRFAFEDVERRLVRLEFRSTPTSAVRLSRTVVTPTLQL